MLKFNKNGGKLIWKGFLHFNMCTYFLAINTMRVEI